MDLPIHAATPLPRTSHEVRNQVSSPVQSSPVKSSQVKSSPVQSSPVKSSPSPSQVKSSQVRSGQVKVKVKSSHEVSNASTLPLA